MLTRKNLITGVASAALFLGFGISGASADTIGFDLDGGAGTYSKEAVTAFQTDATSQYDVVIDLTGGADADSFDSGDTFTETLRLRVVNSEDSTNSFLTSYATVSYIDVTLSGVITDVVDSGGGGDVTDATPGGIALYTFDITFTAGSATWYYDDGTTSAGFSNTPGVVDADASVIATLSLLTGSVDGFTFDNATATADLGVSLIFDTGVAATWFGCSTSPTDNPALCTNDLAGEILLNLVFALADTSVNLQNIYSPGNDLIALTISDNGTTVQISVVPEPSSLFLIGSGLLGLGIVGRRRRRKANRAA